ncbi:DNA-binding protein [Lophiostoma macrostomum CBS 122681]|uniref:DNA-binding protein n=1 Tax=Lophiostoma macrostomum CBS 122681 TaxID=1314788 RepID=A0A6A6TPE7_9PLEO|nr:DNA-binding protein [Lophiostoma macrostomum CBS 122681]
MPQTYLEQLAHFTNFLTAYVHTLLYLRALYPPTTFIRARFHNTPVHQSRHPDVCDWIRDAVSAVRDELLAGTVARIGVAIFWYGSNEATGSPKIMERYMLDVSQFPVVPKNERAMGIEWDRDDSPTSFSVSDHEDEEDKAPQQANKGKGKEKAQPLDADVEVDMSEQFRAALVMLNTRCAQLKALPKHCSFNISMELKDEPDMDPPVGHPQPWVPVQSSLQKTGRKGARNTEDQLFRDEGQDLGGARLTPIRTVEAGVFRFEAWVEEGKAKFEALEAPDSSFTSSI